MIIDPSIEITTQKICKFAHVNVNVISSDIVKNLRGPLN